MRLIDADALNTKFEEIKNHPQSTFQDMLFLDCAMSVVDGTPTLDYEPVRRGEWVDRIDPFSTTATGRPVHEYRCSECKFKWTNKLTVEKYFKYCPCCGAKMDGGKDHV